MERPARAGRGQFYWSVRGLSWYMSDSENYSIRFPIQTDGAMHTYTIDLSANPYWTSTVNSLRFDPCEFSDSDVDVSIEQIELVEAPPTPTPTATPIPTITPTPNPTLTPMPGLIVTNLSPSSYALGEPTICKQTSRSTLTALMFSIIPSPSNLYKKTYILTAQADKDTTTPASFLSFDVNRDVIVYVAIDGRIATPPAWLSFVGFYERAACSQRSRGRATANSIPKSSPRVASLLDPTGVLRCPKETACTP